MGEDDGQACDSDDRIHSVVALVKMSDTLFITSNSMPIASILYLK